MHNFRKSCFGIYSDWALYYLAQLISQTTRRDIDDLIGIRNSPDLRSVRNKEVKFIWIYSLGPRFCVRCPYQRSSPYYGIFHLKKINENFVGTLETVRNREVSVPKGSTVLIFRHVIRFDKQRFSILISLISVRIQHKFVLLVVLTLFAVGFRLLAIKLGVRQSVGTVPLFVRLLYQCVSGAGKI